MRRTTVVAVLLVALYALTVFANSMRTKSDETIAIEEMKPKKEIYLAGGCFWGTEHFIKQIYGVTATEVGYANGKGRKPGYRSVSTGKTGFAETVRVIYDPEVISLENLLDLFYETIDPLSVNKQGNDFGTQYRTGIYYIDKADSVLVKSSLAKLAQHHSHPLAVEQQELVNFYKAEEYHQDYLGKNPNGYCHIPQKLFEKAKQTHPATQEGNTRFTRSDDASLKKQLSPLQYKVTRMNATEPPFNNEYWDEKREGIYVDITTGEPLFTSTDKFDSSCGWPSFSKAIDSSLVTEKLDKSHGMTRIEVRSKKGDAHLGHVFNDGPIEHGGIRYCINSASLRFIPKEEMEKEGYGDYLPLIDK